MDTLSDRLTAWVLRFVATTMLFIGVALLVACLALYGLLNETPVVATIAGIVIELGGLFVLAGGLARYLSTPRGALLPNELAATHTAERSLLGGWLYALAIVLVALPAWLVIRLQPFLADWERFRGFVATLNIWEGANANWSGIILLPLFAALTPPLIELAAMVMFVAVSMTLVVLLLVRSLRFPRFYIVCAILLSALVLASVRGADAAMVAAEASREFIAGSNPTAAEAAQMREIIGQYTSTVSSTANILLWALCAYLIFVPAMFYSRRVRVTFTNHPDGDTGADGSPDVEAITRPTKFRG